MMDRIEATLGRVLAAWVSGVVARPRLVVLSMLLAAVGAGVYASNHLGIRGDTEALFSPDLPYKQAERRFYDAFPTQFENMFVVVDGVTPERAREAASALARRLREEREDFRMVFLPGGGEFFERNAFLYLDTEELLDLADELAVAQPYLAELSRDGSIRGLASILARGARAIRHGDVEPDRLEAMYARTAQAFEARLAGREYHLSWAEVLVSHDIEGDPRSRVILVQPVLQVADIQPARRAIETLRSAAEELDLRPATGVRVRITGDVALSYEEMGVVRDQAAMAGVGSFVCVAAILFIGLRRPRLVAATLSTLVVGLLYTSAFTAAAVGHFNMISVAFAVLFIGLGVDFGIHVSMRYRELLDEGDSHSEALADAARDVGSSLVLCAVTTATGFFAFIPTEFIGVAELGLISGAGMLISLFCTLTFLPALLSWPPVPTPQKVAAGATWSGPWIELPVRYPRVVRAVALVLATISVLLLPQARFDSNPLNVRDPASESVKTLTELLERDGASPWSLNSIAPDVASAEALAAQLAVLPQVERVVTLTDFVPRNQEEKLEIIEEVALFLGPLDSPSGEEALPTLEERVESLRHLEDELRRLLEEEELSLPESFATTAGELRALIARYLQMLERARSPGESLDMLEESLLGSLPEQLRVLNAALGAGEVTLDDLPATVIEQMVGEQGQVRIQTFPKANLTNHRALAEFVDAVRSVDPASAGSAGEIVGSGRAVVASLQQALLSALLAVATMVFLIWRRLTDTALVLIPLGLASIFTVASAVLLDIPFNFADVIVLPLLLGIGVDSGIHLVHRARVAGGNMRNLLGTSTARAVAFSALTTIASFGTMGLATHRGLATLGQLLTLGVGFTLVCNLLVLPALIALHGVKPEE